MTHWILWRTQWIIYYRLIFSLFVFVFLLISRKCYEMEVQKLTRLGFMFMIVSLYLYGVITQFSSEVWLAGKPQARRNQLRPDAHNNGYKMPMILLHCEEYKAVDTEDHKFSSIRDLQAPRLTSLILGQLWRARKPFSQKHRCGW